MKRLCLILLVILTVSGAIITGCSTEEPTPVPAPTPSPTPAPAPATGQTIELTFAYWTPTQMPPPIEWDPYDYVNTQWIEAIEAQTDGRVKFTYYPAETLVKEVLSK